MQIVPLIIITALLLPEIQGIFDGSLKKLKQKAKTAFNKKYGKDKTFHFLGHDLTEYPGTNKKFRKLNQEKWDEYYACLLAQDTKLGHDFTETPEALESLESTSITFECKLCLSPLESQKRDSIEWDWAQPDSKKLHPVIYTEHILLSPADNSLQIFNLDQRHSGQYLCRLGEAQSAPYFLTVVPIPDEDLREVHAETAPAGPYPQPPQAINNKLIVSTEWGPWSLCNKCKKVGKRHKLGYCTIQFKENKENVTVPAEEEKIKDEDYELLKIFQYGIPCSSYILPKSIKNHAVVRMRKSEIMSGFCKADCPDDKIFEVRDKNGNVIERVNNSAGVYSVLQGVPQALPPVERQLQYAEAKKPAVLTCPGVLNSDTPVQWQVAGKKIVPELVSSKSNGRIYISITDKIHFKEAKVSDSNIYSCWQHEDLAGTVRLIVEKKFSLDFNHHVMLIGMVSVFSTFLYVAIKVFFGRKVVQKEN